MLASYQAAGFPNWSQYELPITDLPKCARFGSYIQTGIPNSNNSSCLYWNDVYGYLFLDLEVTEVSGSGGTTFKAISLRRLPAKE